MLFWASGGSRCCILNGAAARTCQPGDELIICSSVYLEAAAITDLSPVVLTFDEANNVIERLRYSVTKDESGSYQSPFWTRPVQSFRRR